MGGDGDLKVGEGGGEEDMGGFIGGVDGGVLELLNLNGGSFVFLAGGRVDGGIFGAVESRSSELPSSEQNGRKSAIFCLYLCSKALLHLYFFKIWQTLFFTPSFFASI
ncbi:unnamed protein product [Lactuca virosa]|uniref:Uncharacterized protein n=1 Tax=Lactuca virosa TaxID=75947 RepID=A0AAU9NV91_9ASTR|nr:unnamed protein product [Lactuca virosa]